MIGSGGEKEKEKENNEWTRDTKIVYLTENEAAKGGIKISYSRYSHTDCSPGEVDAR